MKITALVENHSECELKPRHGLSLYIETLNHKILFDLGPDDTLFKNSRIMNIDLSEIDTVIISHGHMDHGGALNKFLRINHKAKIYVQRKAFEKHYCKVMCFKFNVGINQNLISHPQVILVEGDYRIDDELMLFTVKDTFKCYSKANDSLYVKGGKDDFSHEQNLMIFEKENALIMGCGHAGVVNIMERASEYKPDVCVGGYHLFNPLTKKTISYKVLNDICMELKKYDVKYYTCHCTGSKAFQYLSERVHNMNYISSGKTLEV